MLSQSILFNHNDVRDWGRLKKNRARSLIQHLKKAQAEYGGRFGPGSKRGRKITSTNTLPLPLEKSRQKTLGGLCE